MALLRNLLLPFRLLLAPLLLLRLLGPSRIVLALALYGLVRRSDGPSAVATPQEHS